MKQIRIENISKDFMTQEVFSNLSFTVSEKQRIALVGPNGAGKSTLMKCLMGHEDISSGIIGVDDNMRIGYLAQVHPHTGQTIYDLMQASFEEVYQYWKTIKETEDKLDDPEQYDRWEKASSQYENMGGFKNEITIEKVLTQINFPKERWNDLCTNLSGGQRVRLAFGQILCQKPDFLLLDEPTNFLDIESIEWLEDYLINTWKGWFFVVSHDRYFLDRICNETWDLEPQTGISKYYCNYSDHLQQKYKNKEKAWTSYQREQEYLQKEKDLINRFRAGSRATMAQSRLKALEKREIIPKPFSQTRTKLELVEGIRSNDILFEIDDSWIGRGTDPLFYIEEIKLMRKNRIAIMGKNGAGKSTFLKTLLKEIYPVEWRIAWKDNIQIGYYSQTHEHLRNKMTLVEEIKETCHLSMEDARGLLGAFQFSGDDVYKKIGDLSGGERSRVAWAILSRKETNLLILDEPTNHLDYLMRESLEKALRNYKGTILFVSHDRYFIDKVATHLWWVEDEILNISTGNYSNWVEKGKRFDDRYKTEESISAEELMIRIDKLGDDLWDRKMKKEGYEKWGG